MSRYCNCDDPMLDSDGGDTVWCRRCGRLACDMRGGANCAAGDSLSGGQYRMIDLSVSERAILRDPWRYFQIASRGDTTARCQEPGCDASHATHGYCGRHYQQHKRSGTLD